MARRDEIVAFANDYLDVDSFADYAPVGLQVEGSETVASLAGGVSASRELFERTRELGAELLLVHHGMFWSRDPRTIDAQMRARLEELFAGDINLVAYHLCLDAHPEIGNNALLADALGVSPDRTAFGDFGIGGPLAEPCSSTQFLDRLEEQLKRKPLSFVDGPQVVERVAICSGAAASELVRAAAEGYDCFVTGEPAEPSMMAARELGITFVAAGHYATETFGVKALGNLLADKFDLDWEFIELENPV